MTGAVTVKSVDLKPIKEKRGSKSMRKRWRSSCCGGRVRAHRAACGSEDDSADRMSGESGDKVQAASLRPGLTGLLTEHVYLAALATGSALRGDTAGSTLTRAALNGRVEQQHVGARRRDHVDLRR